MDLQRLESFVTVAREGSVTAAAVKLRISQPTLSQQIRALEDELGEALLLRKPRGVEPTPAGKVLIEHAARLLDEARLLRERFTHRREANEGRVMLGIIPTIAPYLLPRLLRPFREAFPKVEVQVREARTSGLIRQVVDGSIEFAILSDVTPQDRKKWSLHVKELFREPLLLAVPADHPIASSATAPRPADLTPEGLIHLKDGHCLTDRTLKVCRLERLDPKLECDQLETALAMVGAGMGFAVVPELAVRDRSMPSVVFRPFGKPEPERVISVMKRRSVPLSKPAREMLAMLTGL